MVKRLVVVVTVAAFAGTTGQAVAGSPASPGVIVDPLKLHRPAVLSLVAFSLLECSAFRDATADVFAAQLGADAAENLHDLARGGRVAAAVSFALGGDRGSSTLALSTANEAGMNPLAPAWRAFLREGGLQNPLARETQANCELLQPIQDTLILLWHNAPPK